MPPIPRPPSTDKQHLAPPADDRLSLPPLKSPSKPGSRNPSRPSSASRLPPIEVSKQEESKETKKPERSISGASLKAERNTSLSKQSSATRLSQVLPRNHFFTLKEGPA